MSDGGGMKRRPSPSWDPGNLRQRAEARYAERAEKTPQPRTEADLRRLVHDLEIERLELEIQNEDLREAQAELEEVLDRVTDYVDSAPSGFLTLADDGTILEINLAGAILLGGRERSKLIDTSFDLLVTEECRFMFRAFLERVFRSPALATCEIGIRTEKAPSLWIHMEGRVSDPGPEGRRECRVAFADITDRVLRDIEMQKLVAIIQNSSELVNLATLDGQMTFLNAAGCRMLGIEPTEVARHNVMDVIPGHLRAVVQSELLPALRQGQSWEGDLQYLNLATGALVDVHAITFVIPDPVTGKPDLIANVSLDIEDRKRAENTIREESRRKSEFLAVLSHELRNPLTPVSNSLFILARALPGSEQALKAQAVLGRQVAHLTRLVDDLLDIVRVTRARIVLHRERIDLTELVRRTMDDHGAQFEARGVRLHGNLDPEHTWIDGDATRIAQVLGNLLGNAIKFTSRGGLVEVDLRTDGTMAVLQVSDDGEGIAPEVLETLFVPFAQAPQPLARTRGGLGLGLALVKALVTLHGGTVTATSEGPGRGARFTVRLPLETLPARPEPVAEADAPPPPDRGST